MSRACYDPEVARKKKKARDEAPPPPPTGDARTSLRDLLKGVALPDPTHEPAPPPRPKKQKPERAAPAPTTPTTPTSKPSEALRGADRTAYYDAYAGVRPLERGERPRGRSRDATPPEPPPIRSSSDDEARARLAALVAGGVRFDVERDGDEVRGLRVGAAPQILRALLRRDASPEATLDLHGMRGDQAELEVTRFVRREHGKGARRVCIVHGKGTHSPGGLGVLRDRVVHALTEGGAAPVVSAFATAAPDHGGSGAILVELTR